jgi:hypothetical protein
MFSKDKTRQKRALAFQQSFDASGCVLLLSGHHIQELLSHEDDIVRSQRIKLIKSLPVVARLGSYSGSSSIGTIADIQCLEVAIAFRRPAATVTTVRDEAAPAMFKLGNGAELIHWMDEAHPLLQPMFAKQEGRRREIVAITRSDFAGVPHLKIFDLLKAPARRPGEIEQQLKLFHEMLSRDIEERGDKRISNPKSVSAAFIEDVRKRGMAAIRAGNPGEQILLMHDIDVSEIGPETTVGDVGAMGAFRRKLSVLNETLNFPWSELKRRVSEARVPSGVVESAIAKFHPDTREWDGSELVDRHLACLSVYADVTYVDKRTHEAFRQARQKISEFASVTRRVEKAGNYEELATHLKCI